MNSNKNKLNSKISWRNISYPNTTIVAILHVIQGVHLIEDSFFAPRSTTSLVTHATSTYY